MTRMLQLTPTGMPAILPSRMFWFILVPSPSDHTHFRSRTPSSSGGTERGWSRSRCLRRVLACQQVARSRPWLRQMAKKSSSPWPPRDP